MTDYSATFGPRCLVCCLVTEARDQYRCRTAGCPCYGMMPGSREMGDASLAYYKSVLSPGGRSAAPARSLRSMLVSPENRCLDGDEALELMAVIDLEIEDL